jgi:N-acetylglucosaminyl-diphospho-decaprenol L-rhamnosyltransferase
LITLSVVSHGQASLVSELLKDIDASRAGYYLQEVIVTSNIPEQQLFTLESAPLKVIVNDMRKGFGENHNAAFRHCQSDFFCVVNPDIRLNQNPFPKLLEHIQSGKSGVVGPRVVNSQGKQEESVRPFPSLPMLWRKLFGNKQAGHYPANAVPDSPDWIAGMFMLFDAQAFREVGGFDERYFLYYEDADICARLRLAGWSVTYCKGAEVIHDARRDSHRKLRYLKWHLASMLRFFMSPAYRAIRRQSRGLNIA